MTPVLNDSCLDELLRQDKVQLADHYPERGPLVLSGPCSIVGTIDSLHCTARLVIRGIVLARAAQAEPPIKVY